MDIEAWRQHLYHQTRLKEKNGRIRLLTIQPRQYGASRPETLPNSIHCFLRLAELKEHPPFTVISHRWRATDAIDETKSVLVNGAAVPVSPGLFSVLSHVQKETDPVVVWLDALCINHADDGDREKSTQVAQLAQIYATAEKTLIWLGAAREHEQSDEAMNVLRRLSEEQLTLSAYVANWTPQLGQQLAQKILPARFVGSGSATSASGSGGAGGGGGEEPRELQQELEALRTPLKALLERDYWTHLWSLVELCLSSRGLVVCGRHGLALDQFSSAARALDHIINHQTYSKWLASATNLTAAAAPSNSSSAVLSGDEVSNLSQSAALRTLGRRDEYRRDADSWLKSPDHPLFTLLSRFFAVPADVPQNHNHNQSQSQNKDKNGNGRGDQDLLRIDDARERVFALACLATDTADLGIAADYNKDVDQVYAETSAAFLRKNPRVLQLARGTRSAERNKASWAIDWSDVHQPLSTYFAEQQQQQHIGQQLYRGFNACGPADIRFYRADTSTKGEVALKAGVVDTVADLGAVYAPDGDGDGGLGTPDQQRAYLEDIKRLWEDSTQSISSPYFAEQAAVALAKIPVGDIEAVNMGTSSSAGAGGKGVGVASRAGTVTVEAYKKTVDTLFPTDDSSSPPSDDGDDDDDDDDNGGAPANTNTNTSTSATAQESAAPMPQTAKSEPHKPKPAPGPSMPYLTAMARMAGRRPFRSQSGYVGLGPADLAVGDTLAIPYGSAVPFAFRAATTTTGNGDGDGDEGDDKNEDKEDEHKDEREDRDKTARLLRLVGEVYVFGIMDGEFMKVHRQESVLRIV
ncbi:heterokaryon incompatibility protein-domain-containing protein [Nemania sp. FL0916]|nr:heterokaryon incompatibility protein-domain-containing protein [Nemania sp. FL0916]